MSHMGSPRVVPQGPSRSSLTEGSPKGVPKVGPAMASHNGGSNRVRPTSGTTGGYEREVPQGGSPNVVLRIRFPQGFLMWGPRGGCASGVYHGVLPGCPPMRCPQFVPEFEFHKVGPGKRYCKWGPTSGSPIWVFPNGSPIRGFPHVGTRKGVPQCDTHV